jgi:hypothetical protein
MYLGGKTSLGGLKSGSIMPGRGLVNPAFSIKIVPANDDMQQRPTSGRNNPNTDVLSNLKVGNSVSTKIDGTSITGNITRIIKNQEGDVIKIIIIDDKGAKHVSGVTNIGIGNVTPTNDEKALVSSPAFFAESKFMFYNEFINS